MKSVFGVTQLMLADEFLIKDKVQMIRRLNACV